MDDVVETLRWDSAFFGKQIARYRGAQLSAQQARQLQAHCRDRQIDLVYCLLPAEDRASQSVASTAGFDWVDIRLTLDWKHGNTGIPPGTSAGIRRCLASDVPRLREIAACTHTDTRFYRDGRLSPHLCRRLYELWIERDCAEKVVLVATEGSLPVGYISCGIDSGTATGDIGLLAVDGAHRGRNWGSRLVEAALAWFAENGAKRVTVVTQGGNVAAQRTYQRAGFQTCSVACWYHYWAAEAPHAALAAS